ncbi:MAG: hypothetical protein HY735_24280 [Verrucomicrobia bacterium]|nr:hypothetical protein [Verrucomicrobiota bacterium]
MFENAIRSTGPNQIVVGLWNIPTWNVSGFEERGKPAGIQNEHELVRLLSHYGKGLVTTAERGVANLSYQSGMMMTTNTWRYQPRSQPQASLDSSKVYVTFVISDGDNVGYIQWFDLLTSARWWDDVARGSVRINWTLTPSLSKMMPGVMSYLFKTTTTNDSFITSDAGYGYMLPRLFGNAYLNREEIQRDWYGKTAGLAAAVDMKSLHFLYDYDYESSGPLDSAAVRELNYLVQEFRPRAQLKSLVLDYGLRNGVNSSNADFMVGGIPCFQSLTWGGVASDDDFISQIITNTPPHRPAFMQVFCENWRFTPTRISSIAARLGAQYTVIDAETLGDLYVQSGQCGNPGILGVSCLAAGTYLRTGEYLLSPSANCFAVLQGDGNLVVYKGSGPLNNLGYGWGTGAHGNGAYFAIMQADGNFCVYRGTGPTDNHGLVWQSGTGGASGNFFLSLQDDWNLVVHRGTGLTNTQGVMWQSGVTNTPPNTAITNPPNGAVFDQPATILLAAAASDSVSGEISRVEFYQNSRWLGASSNAPFSFLWTNVLGGVHRLNAKAYDQEGVPQLSAAVTVTIRPKLSVAVGENQVELSWANAGFMLQKKSALVSGDWQNVLGTDGTNTHRAPATNGTIFFRLVKP